jgi:hypothetical protein
LVSGAAMPEFLLPSGPVVKRFAKEKRTGGCPSLSLLCLSCSCYSVVIAQRAFAWTSFGAS